MTKLADIIKNGEKSLSQYRNDNAINVPIKKKSDGLRRSLVLYGDNQLSKAPIIGADSTDVSDFLSTAGVVSGTGMSSIKPTKISIGDGFELDKQKGLIFQEDRPSFAVAKVDENGEVKPTAYANIMGVAAPVLEALFKPGALTGMMLTGSRAEGDELADTETGKNILAKTGLEDYQGSDMTGIVNQYYDAKINEVQNKIGELMTARPLDLKEQVSTLNDERSRLENERLELVKDAANLNFEVGYEKYRSKPMWQQMLAELPFYVALGGGGSATATRTALAPTAAKGGIRGTAATIGRGALLPLQGIETGISKTLESTVVRGISAVYGKSMQTATRLAFKNYASQQGIKLDYAVADSVARAYDEALKKQLIRDLIDYQRRKGLELTAEEMKTTVEFLARRRSPKLAASEMFQGFRGVPSQADINAAADAAASTTMKLLPDALAQFSNRLVTEQRGGAIIGGEGEPIKLPAVPDMMAGKEPWQMTSEEYLKYGSQGVPLSTRTKEELALLNDIKVNPSKYLFHATPSENIAKQIQKEGLVAGGLSANIESGYAQSQNGMVLVFRRSDIPKNIDTADVALVKGWKPAKPIGSFKMSEIGGNIEYNSRMQELGDPQEPPQIAHYEEVKQALREGKPVPAEVLADYPDLQSIVPDVMAGMPEAGIQKGMFGQNKVVRPQTAGKITQGSMEDAMKLQQYMEANKPPAIPPAGTGGVNQPPSAPMEVPQPPSYDSMNRILEQSRVVVERDRTGAITKFMQKIPGIKQAVQYERPGIKMTGDDEKVLVAYVAETAAKNDVLTRAAASYPIIIDRVKTDFGKQALSGGKVDIKFNGAPEQAKNPITYTLKDIADNPELYDLNQYQKETLADLNQRNLELLKIVVDGYGAEIGEYPSKEGGAFLPNVDISEDVLEYIGSEMRAIASGRQKTRLYQSARDRMTNDKTFKPETNIIKLLIGMDSAKARAAAGETFRTGLGGLNRLEVMKLTHPKLAERMLALNKRLTSLRGSAGRLNEKLDKAIKDFLVSPMDGVNVAELQSSLDVRLATGKRSGMNIKDIQSEIDDVRAKIKSLKPAWENANLKPYEFIQQGLYRYYPAKQALLIKEMLKRADNPLVSFIDNVRGTAFSGDLSPILGVQAPLGVFADPIGAFIMAGGGLKKAIQSRDPLVSFKQSELSLDIMQNPDDWSQFFSLIGRAPSGTPKEFAGGFLSKIPGFSSFTESTFMIVTRMSKNYYDKTWKMLVKSGLPELDAKVAAASTATRIYPMIAPSKLGQSPQTAALLNALPTSYSFIRKPSEMMLLAAKGFAKTATFQPRTTEENLAMKTMITMAATILTTAALSQAIDAQRKGDDVGQAILNAINPDPENGKFASIVVGNIRIPLGGPYRGLFRAIYPKKIDGVPIPIPFVGLISYLKNRLNPAISTQLDLIKNEDYYGQKIRKGDIGEQILRILAYEFENILPLTLGTMVESVRTGISIDETTTQVIGQFAGVNVIESKWYEVQSLREKYAKQDYGNNYEDLNGGQRDDLLRNHADLKALYDEARLEYDLKGKELPKIYNALISEAIKTRDNGLVKAADALKSGQITKKEYDDQRGYIRPYYSGFRNALWQMRNQLDPEQVRQLEDYYNESSKPEDKALDAYLEYYSELIGKSELPTDWDSIDRELNVFLGNYDNNIKTYIMKYKDAWIQDLPEPARSVELERLNGIENGNWWYGYSGFTLPTNKPPKTTSSSGSSGLKRTLKLD